MIRWYAAPLAAASAVLIGIGPALSETPRPKPRPVIAAEPVAASAANGIEAAPPAVQMAAASAAMADPAPKTDPALPARDPNRGAVTNLPLPRYVSLKTNEGNARRGPGLTHRIDWVFTKAGMPLKITAEYENWRRVEDADGLGGWVHYSLLSGMRSAIVKGQLVDFHTMARPDAAIAFRAEAGVIARILSCENDWCRVQIEGERGWVPAAALWGVEPGEQIE